MPSRWLSLLNFWQNWWRNSWTFSKCQLYANNFFVEENLDCWHPKTHVPRYYLHSFYLADIIHKCGGGKQYPFAEFRNFSAGRRTRSSQKESDNNGTSPLSSDDETTPKYKKSFDANINANFNVFMDKRCVILIKADNVLFKNRTTKPKFVLTLFQQFLDSKLDRLSLQQVLIR